MFRPVFFQTPSLTKLPVSHKVRSIHHHQFSASVGSLASGFGFCRFCSVVVGGGFRILPVLSWADFVCGFLFWFVLESLFDFRRMQPAPISVLDPAKRRDLDLLKLPTLA